MLTSNVASRLRAQSPLSHKSPNNPPALGPLPPRVTPTEQLFAPTNGAPMTSGALRSPEPEEPPDELFTVTWLEEEDRDWAALCDPALAPEFDDEKAGPLVTDAGTTAAGIGETGTLGLAGAVPHA